MKLNFFLFLITTLIITSCTNGQNQIFNLSAGEFAAKTEILNDAPIIDVRTSGEFEKEHLNNAVNIDWYSSDFDKQISLLDKSYPVFVYCQSGSRSAAAADKMRSMGFKEVYELNGGIIKWKAKKHPTINAGYINKGMLVTEFEKILATDKIVLVDFYAEWCLPCKKMEPYLKEISKDMADRVLVTRINVDEHPALFNSLKLDAVPVLQIYKSNKLIWEHKGFIAKEEVLKELNQ